MDRFKFVKSPYDKKVFVHNTENGRFYVTPEGKRYPSITTVLKDHSKDVLDKWRKRVGEAAANKISLDARTRGDQLHGILEKYIQGESVSKLLTEYPYKIQTLFGGVKTVLDNNLNEVHLQESAIYSDALRTAGRLDLLGLFDGKVSVIDFKGSTKHKREDWIEHYFMQASGYAMMYWEQTKIPVTQIVIIIAYEDGSFDVFKKKPGEYISRLKKEILNYETANAVASLPPLVGV